MTRANISTSEPAIIELSEPKSQYTNDDELTGHVVVNSPIETTTYLRIICEGNIIVKTGVQHIIQYFETRKTVFTSALTPGRVPFRIALPEVGSTVPGSLSWYPEDNTFDSGIKWSLQLYSQGQVLTSLPLVFVPTRPQPDLFTLVEIEETKEIAGSFVTAVLSHAAAGLPQYPLTAGLGLKLRLHPQLDQDLVLSHLRIVLCENIIASTRTGISQSRSQRLLLHNISPGLHIKDIGSSITLDNYLREVVLEPLLSESFSTDHFVHAFSLIVTLSFTDDKGRTSRIHIDTPVEVLGRLSDTRRCSSAYDHDLAYVTDSDEEVEDEEFALSPPTTGGVINGRRRSSISKPRVSFSSSVYVVEI